MINKIIDKRNYFILLIIIALLVFIFININTKTESKIKTYNYFNEIITIEIYENVSDTVLNDIDKIYKKYGKLYKYKDHNTDDELVKILKYGKKLYNESNGLIDITSGKLLKKLKKGESYTFNTNISNLNFQKKETLININIDNIIGAYATEKVVNYLQKNKIKKYIINEDGNIIAGKYYKQGKYSISIMKENEVIDIVSLENKVMMTRGNHLEFKSYMINPLTSSLNSDKKLVVVIGDDINQTNFIANSLYLMNLEDGENFIKKYDVEALWYTNKKIMTKGFNQYFK